MYHTNEIAQLLSEMFEIQTLARRVGLEGCEQSRPGDPAVDHTDRPIILMV